MQGICQVTVKKNKKTEHSFGVSVFFVIVLHLIGSKASIPLTK